MPRYSVCYTLLRMGAVEVTATDLDEAVKQVNAMTDEELEKGIDSTDIDIHLAIDLATGEELEVE